MQFGTSLSSGNRYGLVRNRASLLKTNSSIGGQWWQQPCLIEGVRKRRMRTDEMNAGQAINITSENSTTVHEVSDVATQLPFLRGNASEAMAPGKGEAEESGARAPLSSVAGSGCADTLHELANSVTAILINAQVLDWKLPPYSRLKRAVRELERNAQRCKALMKRLLCQIDAAEGAHRGPLRDLPSLHGPMLEALAVATSSRPDATAQGFANRRPMAPLPPAPGSGLPANTFETNSHRHVTPALARASRKRNDGHK